MVNFQRAPTAYYEIAASRDGKFTKVGNVAHHYLRFKPDGKEGYWERRKSYFHEYLGEDLIVRRINVGADDAHSIIAWQDCYVIGSFNAPVNRDAARIHVDDVAPTPTWEVLCLEVCGLVFRVVSNKHHLLKARISEGRWFFSFDHELAREIAEDIMSSFEAAPAS